MSSPVINDKWFEFRGLIHTKICGFPLERVEDFDRIASALVAIQSNGKPNLESYSGVFKQRLEFIRGISDDPDMWGVKPEDREDSKAVFKKELECRVEWLRSKTIGQKQEIILNRILDLECGKHAQTAEGYNLLISFLEAIKSGNRPDTESLSEELKGRAVSLLDMKDEAGRWGSGGEDAACFERVYRKVIDERLTWTRLRQSELENEVSSARQSSGLLSTPAADMDSEVELIDWTIVTQMDPSVAAAIQEYPFYTDSLLRRPGVDLYWMSEQPADKAVRFIKNYPIFNQWDRDYSVDITRFLKIGESLFQILTPQRISIKRLFRAGVTVEQLDGLSSRRQNLLIDESFAFKRLVMTTKIPIDALLGLEEDKLELLLKNESVIDDMVRKENKPIEAVLQLSEEELKRGNKRKIEAVCRSSEENN